MACRSSLCNGCNLTYAATSHKIPAIAHNSNNYDTKLLLTRYVNKHNNEKLHVLAKNKQKFCCLSIDNFNFIDSFAFLDESLEALVETLKKDGSKHFKHLKCIVRDQEQMDLLLRKGVMCYSYLSSTQKLSEESLPDKEDFYDDLREKDITDSDYNHALKVFEKFECTDLKSYLNLYVKSDVLLLADIFETWRKMCFKDYGLEVVKYLSLPSYAWDALFYKSGIELELITSVDQYNFIESSIRGGLCCASYKHAVANNKYLSDYDPNESHSYIILFDVVSLYATIMAKSPLPYGQFRWLTRGEIDQLDIMNINPKGEQGYFMEVSLEYGKEIMDRTKYFPFAPEKKKVPTLWWSEYTKHVAQIFGHPFQDGAEKLIATVTDKDHYICHSSILKFYLENGMKLKEVHRVLAFAQKPWMKKFVEFNAQKRKEAKSTFWKDLYKRINNCLYGRSLYSAKSQIDFRLVNEKKQFLKLSSKPNFKGFEVISDNLAGVEMGQIRVELTHPLYVGSAILELSKLYMYNIYYNYFVKMYEQNVTLCYMDTDSFLLWIRGEENDPYEDVRHNSSLFDLSNFDKEDPVYSQEGFRKMGTLKSEFGSRHIKSFVCLRAKSYSILFDDEAEVLKSKGLKKHILKTMTFHDYLAALHEAPTKRHEYKAIRSLKNNLFTVQTSKTGLSPFDDKRYVCSPETFDTLPYGHWKIQQ